MFSEGHATTALFRKFLRKPFNVLEGYIDVIAPLGVEKGKHRPRIILTREEIVSVRKKLPEKFIVIGAGARYRNKSYPFFDRVSQKLLKKGFPVVLIGDKKDRDVDKSSYPEEVIDLRGKLSLKREPVSYI
ncbi:MAG: glycosyltransferase family 9 protein [Persephonella sp.]|nr:glycosyltransferase family 9 protein [Persephonella sp.]